MIDGELYIEHADKNSYWYTSDPVMTLDFTVDDGNEDVANYVAATARDEKHRKFSPNSKPSSIKLKYGSNLSFRRRIAPTVGQPSMRDVSATAKERPGVRSTMRPTARKHARYAAR